MKRLLLLTFLALAALPAAAQLGYDPRGTGVKIQTRTLGADWAEEASSGWDRLAVGKAGSGALFDGLAVRHARVGVRLQVRTREGWLPWVENGARTGKPGSPVTGVKLTAENRSIRYRGAFAGAGAVEWVRDGEALEAGGKPLEWLEVELTESAPKESKAFEYRVYFAPSGFTRWLKAGEVAEGTGEKPYASAIEVRGGDDVRTEVSLLGVGWGETALEGEVAGDPTGKRQIESFRLYSAVPIRYRAKVQGRGWGRWGEAGTIAGSGGSALHIEAIALDLMR